VSLTDTVNEPEQRSAIAVDAVAEARAAVRARSGLAGMAARVGFDTITRLRPGFLEQHVEAMLPDLALAIEPHWNAGIAVGSAATHLAEQAPQVTADLLHVTDAYVDNAVDTTAIAVYRRLRPFAPARIQEQIPRIANFVERHSPADGK